jgi:hypothetical protein
MRQLQLRWLQFKRFGEERVLRIHAAERAAGATMEDPACVQGRLLVAAFNKELGPFWEAKKKEADQAKERAAFLAHVTPLALAAFQSARAAGKPGGLALHEADLAVVRDGYKINYGTGAPISSSPVLSKVYGRTGADRAAGDDAEDASPEFV